MHTCGVVLAGGKSSRMGTNKSLLYIDENQPVIQRIFEALQKVNDETIVVTNHPEDFDFLQAAKVGDRYLDMGPLAGLETAMYHIDADSFMIAACDMPFIKPGVYSYLKQQLRSYDAVVPVFDGQVHPLAGIYKRKVLPGIQQRLQSHDLRVRSFFDDFNVLYADDFSAFSHAAIEKHFFNMNNPTEYETAKHL